MIAVGDNGIVARYDGVTWRTVVDPDSSALEIANLDGDRKMNRVYFIDGQRVLIVADGGEIYWPGDSGASWRYLGTPSANKLFSVVYNQTSNTIFVGGESGYLATLALNNEGQPPENFSIDSWQETTLGGSFDIRALVQTGDNEITALGSGGRFFALETSTDPGHELTIVEFYSGIVDDVVAGFISNDSLFAFTDHEFLNSVAHDSAAIPLSPGRSGDEELRLRLEAYAGSPLIQDLQVRFDEATSGRADLSKDRIAAARSLSNLISRGFIPWTRLEVFEDYLQKCLGVPPNNQIRKECLAAFQSTTFESQDTIWSLFAEHAPPGILLLFLLSTLAALYRYNLRLAGFHHSRADALELMALGRTKEDIEQLASIAAVLAADKVVFAKGDAATRQAVDLITSINPLGGRS